MSTKRVLNILRGSFLFLALMAAGTAAVWSYRPGWVETLDANVVKVHMHLARKAYLSGRDTARDGHLEAALELLELAERRTDDVKTGDRLAPTRVATLDLLAVTQRKLGDLGAALSWSERLHAFDERDMINNVRRAELLSELGRFEEAQTVFDAVERVAGRASFVGAAILRHAVRAGDAELAVHAVLEVLGDAAFERQAVGWQCFWSAASSGPLEVAPVECAPLADSRRLVAQVALPPGASARRLRLDLPARTEAVLSNLRIELKLAGGETLTRGIADIVRVKDLEREADALRCTGATDAYFYVGLAEDGLELTGAEFSFELRPHFDDELVTVMQRFDLAASRTDLVTLHGEAAVGLLEEVLAR